MDERFTRVNQTGVGGGGGRVFYAANVLTPISGVAETAEGSTQVETAIGRRDASALGESENTGLCDNSGADRNINNSTVLNRASVVSDYQCSNETIENCPRNDSSL